MIWSDIMYESLKVLWWFFIFDLGLVVSHSGISRDGTKDFILTGLLKGLGLEAPKDTPSDVTPPQYMMDLYNVIKESETAHVEGRHIARIIRSFQSRQEQTSNHLYFNLSGIEPTEQIIEAELHLCNDNSDVKHAMIKIEVHLILDQFTTSRQPSLAPLFSGKVSLGDGWQVFTVGAAVDTWIRRPAYNFGIIITCENQQQNFSCPFILSQDSGKNENKNPFLVVFNDVENGKLSELNPSLMHKKLPNKNSGHSVSVLESLRQALGEESIRAKREVQLNVAKVRRAAGCTLYDLNVDFDDIGWSSWIISPNVYNAYYCQGSCDFLVDMTSNATNHATVQSAIHDLGLNPQVPKPCCVPTRLAMLSILYFDVNDNVVLRRFDNMIAESCGCH